MGAAIYGIFDPLLGVYGYVGQSVDPQKRFGEHLVAGRFEARLIGRTGQVWLPVTRSCAKWLGLLLALDVRPQLKLLESLGFGSGSWRERERVWFERLLDGGHPLTNGQPARNTSLLGWRPPFDRARCPYTTQLTLDDDRTSVSFDHAVAVFGRGKGPRTWLPPQPAQPKPENESYLYWGA